MLVDAKSPNHGTREKVNRYAMPNINAVYTADRIDSTKWTGDYPECSVCGRTHGSFAVHHEPPRGDGSLLLRTRKWGEQVVKPALVLLCEECHRDRHDRKSLKIDWEWDCPEEEARFWSGWFLSHGYQEHDRRFYRHGKTVIEWRGRRIEVREEVADGLPTIAELEWERAAIAAAADKREEVLDAGIDFDG